MRLNGGASLCGIWSLPARLVRVRGLSWPANAKWPLKSPSGQQPGGQNMNVNKPAAWSACTSGSVMWLPGLWGYGVQEGPNLRFRGDLIWLKAVSTSGGPSPSLRDRSRSAVYTDLPMLRGTYVPPGTRLSGHLNGLLFWGGTHPCLSLHHRLRAGYTGGEKLLVTSYSSVNWFLEPTSKRLDFPQNPAR